MEFHLHSVNHSNKFRVANAWGLTPDEIDVLLSVNRGRPFGPGFQEDFDSLVRQGLLVDLAGEFFLTGLASRIVADIRHETLRSCPLQPVVLYRLLQR